MKVLWEEIGLHIVYLVAMLTPAFWFSSGWWHLVLALIPQGILLTRTNDYFRLNRRPWTYLLANELLVLCWAGLFIGLRAWTGRPVAWLPATTE